MELESIMIPATNPFASLYLHQRQEVKSFFHYDMNDKSVFHERYKDLMNQQFNRDDLADCIKIYMEPFPGSEATEHSLAKLRNEESVVVLGGQQAGLLTGPLYTIHKIISIIKLAEVQEEELGKPVVPIFWIAGEDHDYQEINHVYANTGRNLQKMIYPEQPFSKQMASHIKFNKDSMIEWVYKVFSKFGERPYTKSALSLLREAINETNTVTEFFSYIIMSLFKDRGLLIIDSAFKPLRKIEKPFFAELVDKNKEITHAVLKQQQEIRSMGFNVAIEMESDAANLFYYDGKERELLQFDPETEMFNSKSDQIRFEKEELLRVLEEFPERFSNNVVTRPLMQEWLFPTLGFIAGPGEIAYWGELRRAFETAGFKMPPIVPRLNITLLDASIESDLTDLQLTLQAVLQEGVRHHKNSFLASVKDAEMADLIEKAERNLKNQYDKIQVRMKEYYPGLTQLTEKNLELHLKQLHFLKRKVEESIRIQHEVMIDKYDRLERMLKPEGNPQERMWNVFYFYNKFGEEIIDKLLNHSYKFNGEHKIVRI